MAKKYRPSNGTEGEIFMQRFCYRCAHECGYTDDPCDILTNTMIFGVNDPEYPSEWTYGEGHPVCTAFIPATGCTYPTREELEAMGQMRLFEVPK